IIHTLEEEQKAVQNLSPENSGRGSTPRRQLEVDKKEEEERIVHSLEDEVEEDESKDADEFENEGQVEFKTTSDLLEELNVNYQEVVYDEDDFVFIETKEEENQVEENKNRAQEDSMFRFDMPRQKTSSEPRRNNPSVRNEEKQTQRTDEFEAQEQELFSDEHNTDRTKRYSLEDYMEKERELNEAKPPKSEEPRLVKEEQKKVEPEEEEEEEIDPLNTPISRQLAARASERRARMKKFNYKFRK